MALLSLTLAPIGLSEALKNAPLVARFKSVTEDPSLGGRVPLWHGVLRLVTPHPPLWSPITGDDALNALRPLIGYGPETMGLIFDQFKPPELARQSRYQDLRHDRAHNETFDILVTAGLAGFVVYILLFTMLFYYALKWLGLIGMECRLFLMLWFAGGLVASVALGGLVGWHLLGVALPAGMLLGFFIYLLLRAIRPSSASEGIKVPERALWLIALLAAIVMHFIELQFGIAIVATRLYFWFYAALLVTIGTRRLVEQEEKRPSVPSAGISRLRLLFWAIIASFMLITLSFEFLTPGRIVTAAGQLTVFTAFFGGILLLVGALAAVLGDEERMPEPHFFKQPLNALVLLMLVVGVGAALAITNLAPVCADILYRQAVFARSNGELERSINLTRRAIALRPSMYYSFLGLSYLEKAQRIADPGSREQLFQAGERALLTAQRLIPFDSNYAVWLAQLHRLWARLSTDRDQKARHLRKALEQMQAAVRLNPTHVPLYNALSLLYYELGELEKAHGILEQSLRIDPSYAQTHLHLALLNLQLGRYEEAESALVAAMAIAPEDEKAMYQALQKAVAYQKGGQLDQALQEARTALGLSHGLDKRLVRAYISFLQQQIEK